MSAFGLTKGQWGGIVNIARIAPARESGAGSRIFPIFLDRPARGVRLIRLPSEEVMTINVHADTYLFGGSLELLCGEKVDCTASVYRLMANCKVEARVFGDLWLLQFLEKPKVVMWKNTSEGISVGGWRCQPHEPCETWLSGFVQPVHQYNLMYRSLDLDGFKLTRHLVSGDDLDPDKREERLDFYGSAYGVIDDGIRSHEVIANGVPQSLRFPGWYGHGFEPCQTAWWGEPRTVTYDDRWDKLTVAVEGPQHDRMEHFLGTRMVADLASFGYVAVVV